MPTSINEPSTPAFEEVAGALKPTITALNPATCAIGDPDFELHVSGENLGASTVIYFAGHDEPTALNEDGTVSTGVKPSLWGAPVTVQVYVRNGTLHSEPAAFEFTAAAGGTRAKGAKAGEQPPWSRDEAPELTLTAINPDHMPVGAGKSFLLTVTGEGFEPGSTIVFDDEEMPTMFIGKNRLSADVPMATTAGEVDVEVHRGEDMSDVLTFEFLEPTVATRSKTPERKPKKAEPAYKRAKGRK